MGKKIVHVEFPAQDADRAEKFWEGFGGWSIGDSGMEGIDYRMFQDDGWGGAVYPQQEGEQGPIIYFDSDDIDADLAKVRELGGEAERQAADPARRLVRALQGHRRQSVQPLPVGRIGRAARAVVVGHSHRHRRQRRVARGAAAGGARRNSAQIRLPEVVAFTRNLTPS